MFILLFDFVVSILAIYSRVVVFHSVAEYISVIYASLAFILYSRVILRSYIARYQRYPAVLQ